MSEFQPPLPNVPSEPQASQQGPENDRRRQRKRANDLSGREWTRNSISVWSDLRRDTEDSGLNHPAMFPKSLVLRCLECFTRAEERMVLDPFSGSGATVLAAWSIGRVGIGFEINPEYIALTHQRLGTMQEALFGVPQHGEIRLIQDDARDLLRYLAPGTIDICITSPPYWDILNQRRTADNGAIRNYGNLAADLGRVSEYDRFVRELGTVFGAVAAVLKPGGYCIVNVMDLRKGSTFYPFHADLADLLTKMGLIWDDIIIWDRRAEYNNLRPLGYPSVFRINKTHEYLLIFRKSRT
jgi:DNA modification methylase